MMIFFTQTTLANNSPYQQVLQLLNEQKPQQAYQLAESQLSDWEGDIQFDLAFALAAKAVGELEQATFAFERVLAANPSSTQTRYFLAVSYFEIGNFNAAQVQFELLLNNDHDAQFTSQSQQYLNAITQRLKSQSSHWQNWLKLSSGYDDNANNGIKDEFISVPLLGNVRLFAQSQQIESAFIDGQIQLLYVKPQDQLSAWYAGVDAQKINFDKEYAWSRTFIGAVAGYKNQWQQFAWDVNFFYRNLSLDGDDYLDYLGVNTSVSYPLNNRSRIGLLLSFNTEQYERQSLLDKNQIVADVWLNHQINQGMSQRIDVRVGSENADANSAAHIDRDLWGASYQYQWQIDALWGLLAKLDYLNTKHQGQEPLFNVTQKAELLRAELQFEYRFIPQWSALFTLNHLENNSNLVLYDYDRNKLQLSVKYSF